MVVRSRPALAGAIRALFTVVAAIGSFCAMLLVCRALQTGTQPALLSAILTLGVSRRPEHASGMHAALYPLALGGVAIVAGGVGMLFHAVPFAGATVFVVGIALSIWLRNFGERSRRIGALIALPFVAMLVVPVGPIRGAGGPLADLAAVVAAGIVALASVRVVGAIAARLHVVPAGGDGSMPNAPRERKPGTLSVPTRMAMQMTVALLLAFAAGFALFAHHWGWTVLTAFIVCSGAIGRADAAYKGFLRLGGAIVGTIAAALLTHVWHPSGTAAALGIFAALFLGLWLRETSYAYWAACVTLVLALLSQPAAPIGSTSVLLLRLEAIFAGACCAIAACWFVVPIRTTDVVRKRLSEALVALDEFVASDARERGETAVRLAAFERRMLAIDRVAVPVRFHRKVLPFVDHAEHPGRWIDLARECRRRALAIDPSALSPERKTLLRRAIGGTRKAIGAHGKPDAVSADSGVCARLSAVRDALFP